MASKQELLVPAEIGKGSKGFEESGNTEEVAMLRAMGVKEIAGVPVRVVHTAQDPVNSGRGQVVFTMSGASSTWRLKDPRSGNDSPYPASLLRAAFHDQSGTACAELDDLIEQIKDDALRVQIQNKLPQAIACNQRAFSQQRAQCIQHVRHAMPFVKGRNRQGRKYLASANNQKFARVFDL